MLTSRLAKPADVSARALSGACQQLLDKRLGAGQLFDYGDEGFVSEGLSQDPHRALRAFGERLCGGVFLGRGEDHGDLLGLGHRFEAVTRLDAAKLGDRDVHDYEVDPAGEGFLEGRATVGGRDHAEARTLQGAGRMFQRLSVVVCDHDGCSAVHGARFYTQFTFAATVMCATFLSDAAGLDALHSASSTRNE